MRSRFPLTPFFVSSRLRGQKMDLPGAAAMRKLIGGPEGWAVWVGRKYSRGAAAAT